MQQLYFLWHRAPDWVKQCLCIRINESTLKKLTSDWMIVSYVHCLFPGMRCLLSVRPEHSLMVYCLSQIWCSSPLSPDTDAIPPDLSKLPIYSVSICLSPWQIWFYINRKIWWFLRMYLLGEKKSNCLGKKTFKLVNISEYFTNCKM